MCANDMTREAALVEVNNLSIAYGEAAPSVTDVTFSLEEGEILVIVGESGSAMDPIQTIGKQFIAHIRRHSNLDKAAAETKAIELMKMVSLPADTDFLKRYPFELSGGQRQRLGIAMAMAFTPHLLLADEPTSALYVTTQAQIVDELMRLCQKSRTGIIMVTHNIGVAAHMADKIMVMQQGKVVDYGSRDDVLFKEHSAYTQQLLDAVPTLGGKRYVDTVE